MVRSLPRVVGSPSDVLPTTARGLRGDVIPLFIARQLFIKLRIESMRIDLWAAQSSHRRGRHQDEHWGVAAVRAFQRHERHAGLCGAGGQTASRFSTWWVAETQAPLAS